MMRFGLFSGAGLSTNFGEIRRNLERAVRLASRYRPPDGEGLSESRLPGIVLTNGVEFHRAEERIREYCDIEVYRDRNYKGGYDDRHSVTDSIMKEDLEAANNLGALMSPLNFRMILGNPAIPRLLAAIKDLELGSLTDDGWEDVKARIRPLLSAFISIHNVSLAKTMKILHLKRPRLFLILDSYVVKFLTGNDMEKNWFSEEELLRIGLDSLEIARKDIVRNRAAFDELQIRLSDLPTPLTVVRMYDILCWTQEKWVNRADTNAPYGVARKSLDQSATTAEPAKIEASPPPVDVTKPVAKQPPAGEIRTTKELRQIKLRLEGVIVNTASSPPRVHRPLCDEVTEERFQNTVVFNEGRSGRYYLRNDLAEAVREFGAVACKKCKPERPVRPA
jgi:hypothetical protein